VLVGLFIFFGGVAHYGALLLSHKRHKDFVDRYIKHARKMAWGDSSGIAGIPGTTNGNANGSVGVDSKDGSEEDGNVQQWNRKQRRLQEKESKRAAGKNPKAVRTAREKGISTPVEAELTSGPVGAKKRVQAQNGKVLIVDSVGNVFVEEQTEEGSTIELLLDVSDGILSSSRYAMLTYHRSMPLKSPPSTTPSSSNSHPSHTANRSAASSIPPKQRRTISRRRMSMRASSSLRSIRQRLSTRTMRRRGGSQK
jgi:hypothetical protein